MDELIYKVIDYQKEINKLFMEANSILNQVVDYSDNKIQMVELKMSWINMERKLDYIKRKPIKLFQHLIDDVEIDDY